MLTQVPQTNLQLYAQLIKLGFKNEHLNEINRAYLFVARQSSSILRGSGKPFVCHLVGTAALIAETGAGYIPVTAALLHASYQDRLPFPGDDGLEARRRFIKDHFGVHIETLVHDQHKFETKDLHLYSDELLRQRQMVVMLRLADEIEDLLDHGLTMHGRPNDAETVRGSAPWRQLEKARLAPELLRAAQAVDAPTLHQHLEQWLEQTTTFVWPEILHSGEYSSFKPVLADG